MKAPTQHGYFKLFMFNRKVTLYVSAITIITNIDLFFRQFAWSDDFAIRADSVESGGSNTFYQVVGNLRPLYALFLKFTFVGIIREESILFLQLFSLLGMLLLNLIILKILRDRSFGIKFSLILILLTNCLPTFQQYNHFATISIFTWVCAASAVAYHLIPSSRYAFWPFLITLTGTLIYPPAALFGLTLISIDLVQEINRGGSIFSISIKNKIRRILLVYGIGSMSGLTIAYFVGYLLDVQFAERTKLISTPTLLLDKVQFVVSYLFITSIRPLAIAAGDPKVIILQVIPILSLIVASLMTYHNWRQRASILALFVFPLISSVSNVIIAENQFEFRALPGLSFGGLFACLFLIKLQILKISIKFSRKVLSLTLVLLISAIIGNTQMNAYELWGAPASLRKEIVENSVSNLTKNVCLYVPVEAIKPLPRLGVYSMRSDLQSSWVTQNIFVFNPSVPSGTKTYVVDKRASCIASDLVIDFSSLTKLRYRKFVW